MIGWPWNFKHIYNMNFHVQYDSYLSKHGGSSNAFTETEYTCYHFEVKREYLKGALDR